MTRAQFLASLRQANIVLSLDKEGRLLVEDRGAGLTEDMLGQIRLRKAELVDYLLSLEQPGASPEQIIPTGITGSFPLSSAQKRIWMIDQIEKKSASYNIPNVIELDAVIDVELYEQAINEVVARHEILRTVFRKDSTGNVRQWVLPPETSRFVLLYFDSRADSEGLTKAIVQIENDKRMLFDLSQWPLFNLILFRLEDEKYLLYYNMSHIISDGWSMGVLHRDVLHYYEALRYGTSVQLPQLKIQYKDYAVWEQQQVNGGHLSRHRDYWLEHFKSLPPALDLPFAGPRPVLATHNGHFLATYIGPGLVEKLRAFCCLHNGTLFMGLLTVLKALLHRYTGQQDIIIGTPVSGREKAELEDQIGFYINTLALRTLVNGEDGFRELFEKVRLVTLSAYEHQQYPFDRLVEELKLQRDMSRSVLFDIMVILQNQQGRDVSSRAVRSEGIIDGGKIDVKFDVVFDFWEEGDGIYMRADFNTDVYDKDGISRLIEHFKCLLEAAIADPSRKIDDLDFLPGNEKHQLLVAFNATSADYPADKTIVDIFRDQVLRRPDHAALVFGQLQVSYRDLDEWSDQLAHYLLRTGVRRKELIPICMERCPEMIAGILGILKAGAAYVPIDPAYPPQRIAYMLSDTGASRIITCRWDSELSPLLAGLERIDMHEDGAVIGQGSPAFPFLSPQAADLAYVIYTSGSTGQPKGVMIEHSAVVNLISWHIRRYQVDAHSRSTFMAGIGFDATVLEIWSALLSGSTLHILTDEIKLQSHQLVDFYRSAGITHAFIPPVLIPGVVNASRGLTLDLKYILIGGDKLQPVDLEGLSYILVNQYGPTESTVMVTDYPVYPGALIPYPIGKPLSNVRLYILDPQKKLLPIGMKGEIYIGGQQLSRGYWNNEALTADRFITDPFSKDGESRLYRTGDMGRWLADGNIEYRGRADEQVKIRGNRVEPGEVEQALLKVTGIESAVVQALSDKSGNKFLAAYLISPVTQTVAELRRALIKFLPGFMVPEYFVQLDLFPLTPNGKIDKNALPDPILHGIRTSYQYTAPRDNIEVLMTEIFATALNKQAGDIGTEDNFFDMGATSITLIGIAEIMSQKFHKEVKVLSLFQYPTIKDLSEACFREMADNGESLEKGAGGQMDEMLDIFAASR